MNGNDQIDPEGFDPYADTVGPGIYGGSVVRDRDGKIVIGEQYQGHNPHPGPVYDGTGYSTVAKAIHKGPEAVNMALNKNPSLIDDRSTGGATPLHICGMSRRGQESTQLLIEAGADIEAMDTYGYRPLHRMASNNLAVGAEALLAAGASQVPTGPPFAGETPMMIALSSGAMDVIPVLKRYQ